VIGLVTIILKPKPHERQLAIKVIVIVLGQFCLTTGVLLAGMACSFLLARLPEKVRGLISTFIGGLVGSLLVISFAYLIFRIIVGEHSFGLFPFLAAILSLTVPVLNDLKKYRQLKKLQTEMSSVVADITGPSISGFGAMVLGELSGIIASALWLAFLYE
jgi:hypothetical protein